MTPTDESGGQMTVTERERRRMELVDGSAHRTELCEQLAMREYELENLKDENAKLRKQYEAVIADYRSEVAKLRKLAGYMLRCMLENHDCSDCLINGEHCEISYIEEDLRELGIEVNA